MSSCSTAAMPRTARSEDRAVDHPVRMAVVVVSVRVSPMMVVVTVGLGDGIVVRWQKCPIVAGGPKGFG